MRQQGEASAPRDVFEHTALVYGSDQAFMDVALPFVERGMQADEPTLVAVQARNVESLRSVLGGEPEGVTLVPVEQWYETSARTRDKFARWAIERTASGRARLIGEPPWAVGNEAQVRDWARYESVINVAFDGMPISLLCPYDSRELPPEIVEHAHRTHPVIAEGDRALASEAYEDPRDFCRRLDSLVERPVGEPSKALDFNLAGLRGVRRLVSSAAVASGLSGPRSEEIALAVNEIASNAVIHGRPPATLRIWHGDGELICEVTDAGKGISDVLAGQLTPSPEDIGGRGIWLARLLCDAVEIRNGVGCAVSIHAATPELALVG